jgi:hypothetical protein
MSIENMESESVFGKNAPRSANLSTEFQNTKLDHFRQISRKYEGSVEGMIPKVQLIADGKNDDADRPPLTTEQAQVATKLITQLVGKPGNITDEAQNIVKGLWKQGGFSEAEWKQMNEALRTGADSSLQQNDVWGAQVRLDLLKVLEIEQFKGKKPSAPLEQNT